MGALWELVCYGSLAGQAKSKTGCGGGVGGVRASVLDSSTEIETLHCDRSSEPETHTHTHARVRLKADSFLSYPMDPIPISPYSINLILQYISPPSQLARPIPSNLLSRSLLKRHALLEISPEDPSSYLCWPSSGRDRAIQLLESLPMSLDELTPDFPVAYAIDPEHAYAHVHVKSTGDDGLRVLFEWDGEETWKYHDANVMPFPSGTRPSLGDAPTNAASIPIPVSEFGGEKQDKGGDGDVESVDDDAYWNSYGVEDDDRAQLPPSTSKDEVDTSEDAYWAQYASVQGMSRWLWRLRVSHSDHPPLKVRLTPRSHHLCTRKHIFNQHPSHATYPMKGSFPSLMRITASDCAIQRRLHLRTL